MLDRRRARLCQAKQVLHPTHKGRQARSRDGDRRLKGEGPAARTTVCERAAGSGKSPAEPDTSAQGAGGHEREDAAGGQGGRENQSTEHETEEGTASPASRPSRTEGKHGRSSEHQKRGGGGSERQGGERRKGDGGANEGPAGEHGKETGRGNEAPPGEIKHAPKAPAPVAEARAAAISSAPAQLTAAPVTPTVTTPRVVASVPEPATTARSSRAARQRARGQGTGRVLPAVLAPRERPLSGAIPAVQAPTTPTKGAPASADRQSGRQASHRW